MSVTVGAPAYPSVSWSSYLVCRLLDDPMGWGRQVDFRWRPRYNDSGCVPVFACDGRSISIDAQANVVAWVCAAVAAVLFAVGYTTRARRTVGLMDRAREEADRSADEGLSEAARARDESFSKASSEIARRRADFEHEDREQRSLVQANEKRLQKKHEILSQRQEHLTSREAVIIETEQALSRLRESIDSVIGSKRRVLEETSGMSSEGARAVLLDKAAMEAKQDSSLRVKRAEADTKEISQKLAAEVIATAIQRCSGGYIDEPETPPVFIPTDEIRNRIVGRDGKHLKLLQSLTGVEWSIDPERNSLVFSSPDCVRREIARSVAQRLLNESRLHPHKIEDIYDKVRKETNVLMNEDGQRALAAADVKGLHPELVRLLGRLRFRTSYGQNVLTHSIEVARLAGAMAAELGGNAVMARRAGLLHDIGKALDHELEGSHVVIGVDVARKYGESPEITHCIGAHHGDEEFQTIEASFVSSADTLSAGRPGARRETLESYIKRVEALESMASSFDGVDKAYAIHAGREIRVLVKPERVSDEAAGTLSSLVARKLESELEYPGQIRVVVVRETRAVDHAK